MRYIDESCPYCSQSFAEGDDIVVCPDCGTPHHRGCWFAHGRCANSEKHGTGFVWQKAVQAQPLSDEAQEQKKEDKDKKNLDIVCPDCGKVCPNGTLRCPDCGAMLIPFGNMGMGEPPMAQFRPGFDANEDICGIKSGDIALFCRVSGAHYIKSFRKQAAGKKFAWNWGALFFAPYWFFYRKLYKAGAIFMALFVAVNLWLLPLSNNFIDVYDNVAGEVQHVMKNDGEDKAMAVLEERMPEIQKAMQPLMLPTAIQALLHIVAAIAADMLYWRKAKADITAVRNEKTDERAVQFELFRRGGTSIIGGAAAYFIVNILVYAATWLMNR